MNAELIKFLQARLDEEQHTATLALDIVRASSRRNGKTTALRTYNEIESRILIAKAAQEYSPDAMVRDQGEEVFDCVLRLLALPYLDHADYDLAEFAPRR